MATAATEKENKLFDETEAANARVQIANEELAKLRVNFDHSKSECQALKAERDKQKEKHVELSGEFEKTKGTLDIGLKCLMTLIGNLSC